jgi:hypothetical protein
LPSEWARIYIESQKDRPVDSARRGRAAKEKTMLGAKDKTSSAAVASTPKGKIPPAGQRALAEAEERRRSGQLTGPELPKEFSGRAGPDPVRYGDWEVKGIASDF